MSGAPLEYRGKGSALDGDGDGRAVLPIGFGTMTGKFKPSEGNCAPIPR